MYNYKKHFSKEALKRDKKYIETYCNSKGCYISDENELNRGDRGEYYIFKSLLRIKPPLHILIDLYIPTYNNKTTQIDLVFIHSTGIYVIESKNTGALLSGKQNDIYWNQSYKSGKSFKLYNPILQNDSHIEYLKLFLKDYPSDLFYSLLIINRHHSGIDNLNIDHSKLKYKTFITTKYAITRKVENLLSERLSELNSSSLLNKSQIDSIYNLLLPYTKVSSSVKINHIKNIHK